MREAAADLKLSVPMALRDCYHNRHRFLIVAARMKEWFRANGVPSYTEIGSTGTDWVEISTRED
jgi:hypothetical protein